MARRYQYRVVFAEGGPGNVYSNPTWSKANALAFARKGLDSGAPRACVERARVLSRGYRYPYDTVRCLEGR